MISVIVPVYNIEKYIRECVTSIINQNYRDLQIILVDDGSTDSSGRICDEFAKRDSRIQVIHKDNGGLVSARKAGLDVATGEYITYVDGDDWIDLCAYEKMYMDILESSADIVFYGHFENVGDSQREVLHGIKSGVYEKESLEKDIYPRMISSEAFYEWQIFPSVWDMIIKRDLLIKSQYEVDDDISMGEDAACIYPCILMADKIKIADESFYHYRQNNNSMIKKRQEAAIERRKMRLLYNNVSTRLAGLSGGYDVSRQWIKYMMFLMLPRADHLYLEYDKLPYLFPYNKLKKGSRIAIYGAGTYGQRIYNYIRETKFCDVVAWFDRNYEQLSMDGLEVINPEKLEEYQFDGIVIANMFAGSRKQIEEYILSKKDCVIFSIDEEYIFSEECLRGFGLI